MNASREAAGPIDRFYSVIPAGGIGSRLWPLSRELYPKQLHALAGEQTLLQQTALRLQAEGFGPPLVICNEQHRFIVAEQLREAGIEPLSLVVEPVGRNTAPAIAAAAVAAMADGQDPVLLVLAADHAIPDTAAFHETVRAGVAAAEAGKLGHHNMAMGVANSIAAVEAGANRIDAAAAGLGAGAGNTPLEVLVAVCERMGIETGVDLFKISDVAEDIVTPLMDHPIRVDRDSLTLGFAGVYSSFLLFAKRAEKKYGVPAREILLELGRRKLVGGQEDMIEDAAITMSRARKSAEASQ